MELEIDFGPSWFNQNGRKMTEIVTDTDDVNLTISSKKAVIKIHADFNELNNQNMPLYYLINWCVVNEVFYSRKNTGGILLKRDQLKSAFGLTEEKEAFLPVNYIRQGDFLNIPVEGTSEDGFPHISIFLSEEIKFALVNFLKIEKSY